MSHEHHHHHDHECVACKLGMNGYMREIEKTIKRFGHAVVGTGTTNGDGDPVSMTYTVGLSDVGLPEIILFAVPMEAATQMLNDAADMLRAGKLPLDTPITELANMPSVFKRITPEMSGELLTVAANRKHGVPVDAIQMVWPDPAGKFPWDAGFDQKFTKLQPSEGFVTLQ